MKDQALIELDHALDRYQDTVYMFPEMATLSRSEVQLLKELVHDSIGTRVKRESDGMPVCKCKCGSNITIPLKPRTVYCRQCGKKYVFVD